MRRRLWLRVPKLMVRTTRRRHGLPLQWWAAAALGLCVAFLLIRSIDNRFRPLMIELATAQIQNAVNLIVTNTANATLAEQAITYGDMVTLEKDNSGRITALTSNSAEMNRLQADLLQEITEQVNSLDTSELGIPLGNLTRFAALSDRGPLIFVRVLSVGKASAAFHSSFSEAGVNQTYHTIYLDVWIDATLLIPGGTVTTNVVTTVPVAETVIVGQVPDTYLQFGDRQ